MTIFLAVFALASCWVTPEEVQIKIDEFEPIDTGGVVDTAEEDLADG